MDGQLPPHLGLLLVRTSVPIGDNTFTVNIPASWDSSEVDGAIEMLTEIRIPEDDALQAFLSLPDVSVGTDNIMDRFREAFAGKYGAEEDLLRALSPLEEWQAELADWCVDHGIEFEALDWNLEPLMERLRAIYDVVQWKGELYAFVK